MEIADRCVLITGAARRIGAAVATALAVQGARVALHCHRSVEDARRVAARFDKGRVRVFRADLRKEEAIEHLLSDVRHSFGSIDILINNASVFGLERKRNSGAARRFDEYMSVNLRAPYLLSLAVGREMASRRGGRIINIGDWMGHRPSPSQLPYALSKGALLLLTQMTALAFAPTVLVNAVAPGAILPPEAAPSRAIAGAIRATPLRRRGTVDDIVNAVLFLIRSGDYITGNTLFVDGGRFLVGEPPSGGRKNG